MAFMELVQARLHQCESQNANTLYLRGRAENGDAKASELLAQFDKWARIISSLSNPALPKSCVTNRSMTLSDDTPPRPDYLILKPRENSFYKTRGLRLPVCPAPSIVMGYRDTLRGPRGESFFHNPNVSERHCAIFVDQTGHVFIRDLASKKGTFVNGKRPSGPNQKSVDVPLRKGDWLELGEKFINRSGYELQAKVIVAQVGFA